jgi:hypothetical protein
MEDSKVKFISAQEKKKDQSFCAQVLSCLCMPFDSLRTDVAFRQVKVLSRDGKPTWIVDSHLHPDFVTTRSSAPAVI